MEAPRTLDPVERHKTRGQSDVIVYATDDKYIYGIYESGDQWCTMRWYLSGHLWSQENQIYHSNLDVIMTELQGSVQ